MAIDDPLDQAVSQVEAEKRERSPVLEALGSAKPFINAITLGAKLLQGGWLSSTSDLLIGATDAFSRNRSKYLLDTVISEVKFLLEKYEELDEKHREFLDTDWLELLADADRKARVTRGKDRIQRIARIISGAAVAAVPEPPDATEEMMRIAMSLDDQDVQVLKIVVEAQGKMIGPGNDVVTFYSAYSTWAAVAAIANNHGIGRGELASICGKLESFGLLTRGERTGNIHGSDPVPFALLIRGLRFLRSAQFTAAAAGA